MESFCLTNLTSLNGDSTPQCRQIIHNVYSFFNELKEYPNKLATIDYNQPRKLTALVCGTSIATVDRIRKELSSSGSSISPRQNYVKPSITTDISDFDKSVIKQIICLYYNVIYVA